MKMMPKEDLITLIKYCEGDYFDEDRVIRLFENYGDDYFKEGGFYSDWTLTKENEKRKQFLQEVKADDSSRTN